MEAACCAEIRVGILGILEKKGCCCDAPVGCVCVRGAGIEIWMICGSWWIGCVVCDDGASGFCGFCGVLYAVAKAREPGCRSRRLHGC